MRAALTRVEAVVPLAVAIARYYRRRIGFAIVGIAVAVLLVTLLAGLWHGVATQGVSALDATNRDLWMAAPVQFAPGAVGGVDNGILDAHAVAHDVRARPGVGEAEAVAFKSVYVSQSGSDFISVVGVGVTGSSAPINLVEGPGFDGRDVHFADGTYEGPMTHQVIIDERLAAELDLGVGNSLYVGGTLRTARQHEFVISGISSTFSSFIGASTVVLHLSELQTITGATGSDQAAMIAITLEPGADQSAVVSDLTQAYPDYTVRTNAEQFQSVLGRQVPVLASVATITVIGVVAGVTLVVNLLTRLVYMLRTEFAALKAIGLSSDTITALVAVQALGIGLLGGLIALVLTPFVAFGLNRTIAAIIGFEGLIATPGWVYWLGLGIAIGTGVLAAGVAGWQISRLEPGACLKRDI